MTTASSKRLISFKLLLSTMIMLTTAFAFSSASTAQSVEAFYKGKQVRVVVAGSTQGGYGTYTRVLSEHIGDYIPGKPHMLFQSMPGAGGLVAANWIYNAAPQDGTVIGGMQRGIPMLPLLGEKGPKYDAQKFQWVGSLNNEVSICAAWHASGIKTIQDVMKKELIIGATGPGDTEDFPAALNNILGTKFRIIQGYSGGSSILAMERGEVSGRCGWSWTSLKTQRPQWLREKKVHVLIQLSLLKLPEIGDVPLVSELTTSEKDKQVLELIFARQAIGRPFVMGPGVPADRLFAVRKAFMAVARDEKFLARAKKSHLDIAPVSGEETQKIIAKLYKTPQSIVTSAKEALVYKGKREVAKITFVKHTGEVTEVQRGGRRFSFMHEGKKISTSAGGTKTKVTIGGKPAKRGDVKAGMVCTFTYPGPGAQSKQIDCK